MADDLEGLSRRLGVMAIRVEARAVTTVRRAALAGHQAVVLATPVDTGRARSNWLVSVDAPNPAILPAYAPGRKGSTGADNARASIDAAQRAVKAFERGNRAIYLTNNLPYIGPLNSGHSAQAPAGFVERAVAAAQAVVRGSRFISE